MKSRCNVTVQQAVRSAQAAAARTLQASQYVKKAARVEWILIRSEEKEQARSGPKTEQGRRCKIISLHCIDSFQTGRRGDLKGARSSSEMK